jgi:hypothetical protein
MESTQKIKKTLLMKIDELPENKLHEVLDFVNFILFSNLSSYYLPKRKKGKFPEGKNALMKFIGGVSHGSLAKEIDKELYGA